VTVELRPDIDGEAVRRSLQAFIADEAGIVRMDRPLRDTVGGRHFHLAARTRGSGTLEVDHVPDPAATTGGEVHVVLRPHWTGTWAGGAFLRLAEHLAADLGR
jgi:hypothetical protein